MSFEKNCLFINRMLDFNKIDDEPKQEFTYLVHSSIYPMVQKYLTRLEVTNLQHFGSYELTVGTSTYDMEMVALGIERTQSTFSLFSKILTISQFTYFWENKLTLFREAHRYSELEKFIAIHGLNKHVISVEAIAGVNSLGVPIKMVTFDITRDEIQLTKLFDDYLIFLQLDQIYNIEPDATASHKLYHYYFTNAFPWHQPKMLLIHSIPFHNQRIFLELQTFLICMRELTYEREPHLDLISLCSLKLAFCDDRNLTEASCDLEYEIDALIERFLRRMKRNNTYIRNCKFDLRQYAVDANSTLNMSYPAVHNLIYTFQHIFQRTNVSVLYFNKDIRFNELPETLKLIDENKDLDILRGRSNICYKVDGINYKKMNSKLFCELLKCCNVQLVRLDTNYKWTNESYLMDLGDCVSKKVTIQLFGTNQFNFIDDFIQFLKTIPIFLTSKMELIIGGATLKSYHIFKNLDVEEIHFQGPKITLTMLTELLDSLLKNIRIKFEKCTIEDETCTWSLLINGFDRENIEVEIFEEEKTWQNLFDSIANHLTELKLNEFNFKCDLKIRNWYSLEISVNRITFMFDDCNKQLNMRDISGQITDLYCLKNCVPSHDYKKFDFYQ